MATATAAAHPLYVDLDGTLLATDVLWESLLLLARRSPGKLVLLPVWLLRGKAHFKRRLSETVLLDPRTLPYRAEVLELLEAERRAGRALVLATATDAPVAQSIADHLGIFSAVLASDGVRNLSGANKLAALREHVGGGPFEYVGNSAQDLPLWRAAASSVLVDPPGLVLRRARASASVRQVVYAKRSRLKAGLRALRVHQWAKNVLLFTPVLLAHKLGDAHLVLLTALAFLAFSLCASAVYITNDLLDLDADRAHPRKRRRPFAAGELQIRTGVALVPVLLTAAFALSALTLPVLFTATLAGYFALTTLYSVYLKRVLLVDVFLLSGLYTLRVLAGGVATGIEISPWLAAFSLFLFTSLAFLKRYSELRLLSERSERRSQRRDYRVSDIELIRGIGPTSGYVAVLVLALYINSVEVLALYPHPKLLWLILPVMLYWVTRMWFLADRGRIPDDPIVFTARDRVSYLAGGVIALTMLLASMR